LLWKLLYFGFPTGLMYLTEAGGFAVIVLRIGRLGDIPLRATTMAINFNMVAFIPLVGVSIAASVLVGRHLLQSGPARASVSIYAALLIGLIYSGTWLVGYLTAPDLMMSMYEFENNSHDSKEAIDIARGLLKFVAISVVLDATQLIVAGALRGAGDTWFVLAAGFAASATALVIGITWEPAENSLHWWWWMVTLWVWLLATVMVARFLHGNWKRMRMV
jgi:MATE family multidrug resistance protein